MEERLGHSNQERQEGGATEKLFGLLWRLPVRPAGSTTLGASYLAGVHLTYTCQDPSPSRPANRSTMADVTAKRDCRDRDRIKIHQDYERVVVEA